MALAKRIAALGTRMVRVNKKFKVAGICITEILQLPCKFIFTCVGSKLSNNIITCKLVVLLLDFRQTDSPYFSTIKIKALQLVSCAK